MSATSTSAYANLPVPNYTDPVRRTWLPAFAAIWQIAATILVSGRLYLRARNQAGGFGFDDVLILLGWILSIGMTTAVWIDVTHYGLDRHVWDMKLSWAQGAALTGWISQVFFVVSSTCTKVSVLLFYRRMVKETLDVRWVWALRTALCFTVCYGVTVTVAYFNACTPLEATWLAYKGSDYHQPHTCLNAESFAIGTGSLSVLSDISSVALPCLMLRQHNLDLPKKQKIALNVTFALGLLVSGAGLARTYYLWKIEQTIDSTWCGFDLFAWSIVECQLAIICACAPSSRAFFRLYIRNPLKGSFRTGSWYARERTQRSRLPLSTSKTRTQRDSRGFHDLKELESGVHGVACPLPAILGERRSMQ